MLIFNIWLTGAVIYGAIWTAALYVMLPKTAHFQAVWTYESDEWRGRQILALGLTVLGVAVLWFVTVPYALLVGVLRKRRGLSFFPMVLL